MRQNLYGEKGLLSSPPFLRDVNSQENGMEPPLRLIYDLGGARLWLGHDNDVEGASEGLSDEILVLRLILALVLRLIGTFWQARAHGFIDR